MFEVLRKESVDEYLLLGEVFASAKKLPPKAVFGVNVFTQMTFCVMFFRDK